VNAVLGRHAIRRRRLPAVARRTEADPAEIVASLQATCRGWLIMWSRWRQKYTGFACFTREPLIVDEAKVDRFLARLQEIERRGSGLPHGHFGSMRESGSRS
jgi:hypothetical protein